MKASIITIGDEILIGQIVDTNSAYIAKLLSDIGFRITEKISIGDNAEQIARVVGRSLTTTELTIITGGLGPTKDDITKETLAKLFDSKMVYRSDVAQHVKEILSQRNIAFNALNRSQAMLPEACEVIANAHGTAPGMWFEREGHVVVSLPGVPFEMRNLMADQIIPRLKQHFTLRENIHRTMITSGLPESILAERIEAWEEALPSYISLAYLPSFGRVRLRLSAYQVACDDVGEQINQAFGELEKILADYFVGYEGASIEQIIHSKLTKSAQTLAVAESCTGGAIAAKFTAMAGASAYFKCGVVSYSNQAKEELLGVQRSTLEQWGAVSEQVAIEMALGVQRAAGSDFAVATTGIAGPSGGSDSKPVGTVWFAVATPRGAFAFREHCGTDREQVIGRATTTAISLLNKNI